MNLKILHFQAKKNQYLFKRENYKVVNISYKLLGIDEETGRVVDPNFLREQLPVRVLDISPSSSGISGHAIQLYERTAITIIFNRAVVKLGSDFGSIAEVFIFHEVSQEKGQ